MNTYLYTRSARVSSLGLALLASTAVGCSNAPTRAKQPEYSDTAGEAALVMYDTNKDGVISSEELQKAPAIKASLALMDLNGDRAVTAEEINSRVSQWRQSKIGEMPVRCKVLLDGTPVADARVTFEPESFMGGSVHPATGVTDADGIAAMSIPKQHLADSRYAGVSPGFYRIIAEVSTNGITQRYTTGPRIGCEVALDAPWVTLGIVDAEFKSR